MYNELREKRLRKLVHGINRVRKKQAKKIDIICNNLISAHRSFIKNLDILRFAANFYESIIDRKNIDELFDAAGELIRNEIKDVKIAFFLRQKNGFEIYPGNNAKKESVGKNTLEDFFTDELVADICMNNRLCSLEQMLTMGLQLVPTMLNNLSAFAVPLIHFGTSIGFILIYRVSDEKIDQEQLDKISSVSAGLARSISRCQVLCSKSD